MSVQHEQETEQFLREFFDGRPKGNLFDYDTILSSDKSSFIAMRGWVDQLRRPPHRAVLPRYQKDGQGNAHVEWYGVAKGEQDLKMLADDVQAFVGRTYSDFQGQRATLNPDDPVERAVRDFAGDKAFRFRGDDEAVRDALNLMYKVRDQRVHRGPQIHRSPGVAISEFKLALADGTQEGAIEALQYIKEHHLVSALNRDFLQIQLLSTFGRWQDILDMDLEDLLVVRRPLRVTQALLKAVYHVELRRFEEADDAKGALGHFTTAVQPAYGSLLGMRSSMRAPEVLKLFMMRAVAPDSEDPELREELLEVADEHGIEAPFLHSIAELGSKPVTSAVAPADESTLQRHAAEALDRHEYDRAYKLATELPPSQKQAELLLRCGYELQSVQVEREAVSAVDSLQPTQRQNVLAHRLYSGIYNEFTSDAEGDAADESTAVPTDWLEWFQRLQLEPGWNRARATEIAERGVSEWDVESLLQRDGAVKDLVDALTATREAKAERTVEAALPSLLEFLQSDPAYPRLAMHEVYDNMVDLIAMSSRIGEPHLNVFYTLCETVLTQGTSKERYTDILDIANDLWGRVSAITHVPWLLDFLDLLVVSPRYDEEAYLRLLQSAAATFREYGSRIESEDVRMLQRLCRELGHSEACEGVDIKDEDDEQDPLAWLDGRTVAIYTLMEQAGKRAQEVLERACDQVKVRLSNAKVATPRLSQLARNSDVFVVVVASAKHAATNFIRDERGDSLTLYPRGKGTSSILRTLRNAPE